MVTTLCSGEGGELIGDTNGGVGGEFTLAGMARGDLNGGVCGESGRIGTLSRGLEMGVLGRSVGWEVLRAGST